MPRTRRPIRISGTVSIAAGTAADTVLESKDVGSHRVASFIDILAVWVTETAAPSTATTYDVHLSEAQGWTVGDAEERYSDTGNTVGTPVRVVPAQPIRARLDENGQLHARIVLNASDTATYEVQVDADLVGRG